MTPQVLAPHVLVALHSAQKDGRRSSLDSLVEEIKVRRGDVRRAVSALHREGLLDAMTMRLTLMGFALGAMYAARELPPLRRPRVMIVAAA